MSPTVIRTERSELPNQNNYESLPDLGTNTILERIQNLADLQVINLPYPSNSTDISMNNSGEYDWHINIQEDLGSDHVHPKGTRITRITKQSKQGILLRQLTIAESPSGDRSVQIDHLDERLTSSKIAKTNGNITPFFDSSMTVPEQTPQGGWLQQIQNLLRRFIPTPGRNAQNVSELVDAFLNEMPRKNWFNTPEEYRSLEAHIKNHRFPDWIFKSPTGEFNFRNLEANPAMTKLLEVVEQTGGNEQLVCNLNHPAIKELGVYEAIHRDASDAASIEKEIRFSAVISTSPANLIGRVNGKYIHDSSGGNISRIEIPGKGWFYINYEDNIITPNKTKCFVSYTHQMDGYDPQDSQQALRMMSRILSSI